MASELKTARLVYAQYGVEFDGEKQAAYEELDALAEEYETAKAEYLDDRNDETRAAYKDAARAYAAARTEIKAAETADPVHPRGISIAHVVHPRGTDILHAPDGEN
jgi:hypothetical protein